MVNVVGPAFSLAASGTLGKALFYYDTKYGARVRVPKRTFTPPGQAWILNKAWFKAANVRQKTLNKEQKLAWQLAYPDICDSWRDIFMGKQIEAWNLSPLNDLTWPVIKCPHIADIVFGRGIEYVGDIKYWFGDYNKLELEKWSIGSLWWNKLDNAAAPISADSYTFRTWASYNFEFTAGKTNYLWGGVRYLDGTFEAFFLESFVR